MKILNSNDKMKKTIIESAMVILIMSLYIAYGKYYIPIFVPFMAIPFIILGIKNGIKNNITSMAITFLLVGMVLRSPGDAILLLVYAPLSIGLNYMIKKRKKTNEILLISTGLVFLSLLLIVFLGKQSTGMGLVEELEGFYTQILTTQQGIFKEMGMTNYEIIQKMNFLEAGYEYILITLPSILIIGSLFISSLNYLFLSILLRKMGYQIVNLPKLSRFKLPNDIILGTGLMFLIILIMGKLDIPYSNALLANISFLVGFLFLIQGLSLIDYYLINKVKMKLIFRITILIIIMIIAPLSSVLVLLGMFDSIFDIRKIGKRKSL